MRPTRPALILITAALLAGGCKSKKDVSTPAAAARSVWAAADEGPEAFRGLYPTDAELRTLFESKIAEATVKKLSRAAASLKTRRAKVQVLAATKLLERDVPPGNGLKVKAHLALVILKLKVVDQETEDKMALVRLGKRWAALPKFALRFLK